MMKPSIRIPVILLGIVWLASCYEPREGCLDIEATNFDAAADNNCCCTYPELKINLLPRYDTLVWKPDTAYEYASGKWFRLKQAVFYLSAFELLQSGQSYPVSDTLAFSVWDAAGDTLQQTLTDDYVLIRRTQVKYSAGTFRPSGQFGSVRFRVGLQDAPNRIIPGLVPAGHILAPQAEQLWLGRDTGFVALKLILTRDTFSTTPPDTLVFHRPDFDNLVIQKDGIFNHESGYDMELDLTTDFREMFRDVDLSSGDKVAWKNQIWANLTTVFRVSQ
ncbi:MAG: hypothetical protein EP344_02140 [Bacteroidetes bacterium]|nr:MAG: hypothetical protein EP344_02140 [Bacteroidota bacterium]